jgi:hypothetical protein
MYAGGRPDERARAVHRRYIDGWLPRLLPIAAVLHVRGRVTGADVRVPIVVVPYRWRWHTVAMLGEKANWVHNVRAAGGEAEVTHGRRRPELWARYERGVEHRPRCTSPRVGWVDSLGGDDVVGRYRSRAGRLRDRAYVPHAPRDDRVRR